MWPDIQFALRSIAKQPLFHSVVILTLALGIGANTAIFTVVNGVLLQSLPYPHPERLMMVWTHNPRQGFDKDVGTYPNFEDWRRASQSFQRMSGYAGASVTLTESGDPAQLRCAYVTHEFFETMGVAPALGRAFGSANGQAGGERVVIVAHGFWMRRFGADPDLIGRSLMLDGVPHEVIGVMPASFQHPADAEIWMPLAPVGRFQGLFDARGSYWLTIIGRLKPGVTQVAAQAEMDVIAGRLEKEYPSNAGIGIRLVTLQEELVGDVKRPLLILLGAVCFVLLIACANVANLLLTRAASRQRELAIRAALGADRGRLVRQLLIESVMLGLLGGAAGLMIVILSTHLLQTLAPAELPRLSNIAIDRQVLAYVAGVSVFTSLLFGLVPALHASRRDAMGNLKEGGRTGSEGRRGGRMRAAIAVGELAIALILLVGAGLLIRSFIALNNEDPGFATRGMLALRLQLPRAAYGEPERITGFYEQLVERLEALPGVQSAAAGSSLLLSRLPNSATINIEGRPPLAANEQNIPVPYDSVTPEYFSTLQIPLRTGRVFTHADGPQSQVVMVNESFVRRFFPGEDPLGRRVTFDDPSQPDVRWQTIVGVVADTRRGGFEREPWAETYFPMRQAPTRRNFVFLRTDGDPISLIGAAQAAVWSIDRNQAIAGIQTVPELLAQRELNRRFTTLLLGVFAAVALVLAIIGTYGVIAHATAQRTQEIGIRIALGAEGRMILRMVLIGGLRIAAAGLAMGVVGALALTHVLSGLLFGVGSRDPLTFVVVPAALLVAALAACWIPARRAMQVEPVIALRGDS